MAQEKHVILRGKFFDTLYQITEEQSKEMTRSSFHRKQNMKGGGPILRNHLTLENAVSAINRTGYTVHELFLKALGPDDVPSLSSNDKQFIDAIASLTTEQRAKTEDIINASQLPWWEFPGFDDPENIKLRFQTIVKYKYPMITRKSIGPIFASLGPMRELYAIDTDKIPAVCAELSCAYPFAMRIGFAVHYYSKEPNVDRIYHKYKLMQPDLQYIPLAYALAQLPEGK